MLVQSWVENVFCKLVALGLVWTLCFLLAYHSNPTLDQCLEHVPAKPLVLFPILAKLWCLSAKPFNPWLNEYSILFRSRVFYCGAFHFQHLETCTLILARLNMSKLNRFMTIITFLNTIIATIVMHHVISRHCSMHGVASSSVIRRLTNGYAFECNIVGCLRFPLNYLVASGTVGLLFLISIVVVFSHMTMMPRRNLDSRVRCSHMIELLGARWCLGMCDVTHCNPLLCNLTSVLTSGPYSSI